MRRGPEETSLRAAGRRPLLARGPRCSCELLLGLAAEPLVRDLLGGLGLGAHALAAHKDRLHAELPPEPADWRLRLGQRGSVDDGGLDLLLAIARTAESHGYQLLERAGASCALLRKQIAARLRELGPTALHRAEAEASPASPRPRADDRPLRASMRRAAAERDPRDAPAPTHVGALDERPDDAPAPLHPRAATPADVLREARAAARRDAATPPATLAPAHAGQRREAPLLRTELRRPRLATDRAPAEDSHGADRPDHRASRPRGVDPSPPSNSSTSNKTTSLRPAAGAADPASRPSLTRRAAPHPTAAAAPQDPRATDPASRPSLTRRTDLHPAAVDPPRPSPARHTDPRPAADAPRSTPPPSLTPIDPAALPPLHGHERLLARLADALQRSTPRAPLLVGPHGSGRTLIASHLARLLDRPVFRLLANAHEGAAELRDDLRRIAERGGVAILDDLDRHASDAPPEHLSALTAAWASGQPPLLVIVSPETRARLEGWLPGVLATLDPIEVPPLAPADLRLAIDAAAPAILDAHDITLAADTDLGELIRLAEGFLAGLAMPGRALDLLDLACTRSAREGRPRLDRATLVDIVAERSGLPRGRIDGANHDDLLDLEAALARRVVGHEAALHTLAQLVRRSRAGFASQRPIASVLLLGPSGVGKTEIAKALAAALFDHPDALVRLDMSEYAEPHAVARIVGAPPGYVGHERGGALTDPLLERPHCVVLLDEIEKAHRDVHQLLLQVFDEGRLTDGRGRTVDFRAALVLMTSNLGAECRDRKDRARLDEPAVLAAARAAFPVELWNRIEAPLVLHPLSRREIATICHRLVRASSDRLFTERGLRYRLSDAACDLLLARSGDDLALGARPLRHLLAREVEPLVADAILRGRLVAGASVEITVERGRLALGPAAATT